jgi:hypothetical protein
MKRIIKVCAHCPFCMVSGEKIICSMAWSPRHSLDDVSLFRAVSKKCPLINEDFYFSLDSEAEIQ